MEMYIGKTCGVYNDPRNVGVEPVTQLILSPYLLVQSKLRLRHSMTSLIDTLQLVHYRHKDGIINPAMMAFIYRILFSVSTVVDEVELNLSRNEL